MQLKSASESGSITTTAGRVPMAAAKEEIHVRYAAGVPAPPPEWPPHASRPGMSEATSTGSLVPVLFTYPDTAVPMSPLQAPNQRATGLLEMFALIAAWRPSSGWSRTHTAGVEPG